MQTRRVVVATDCNSMCQALYVDGVLVDTEDTIYAGDIEHAAEGRPIFLSTLNIDLSDEAVFPKSIDECIGLVVEV